MRVHFYCTNSSMLGICSPSLRVLFYNGFGEAGQGYTLVKGESMFSTRHLP